MNQSLEQASNFLSRADDGPLSPNVVDRRLVTLTAPASAAAEQYRTLYYRLERMRELKPLKLLAFTSALPGEGKTVTAVNLALTSARANPGRRVLLVDADLRRSQVASYLGIRSRPGLSELLSGECEAKQAIRRFRQGQLLALPAGQASEEPGQLLAGARMKQLVHALRQGFDEVYLDLPPVLPFADAAILSPLADGLVMVIRARVTSHRQVQQAMEQLSGVPWVGCVLNAADLSAQPYARAYAR